MAMLIFGGCCCGSGGNGDYSGSGGADAGRVPLRDEIGDKYKWRLEDMFATDSEWERECEALKASFDSIAAYRGRLSGSAETLFECLQAQDDISSRCEMVYAYARMRRDEDNNIDKYQVFAASAMSLYSDVMAAMSYIAPEIIAMEDGLVEKYLGEDATGTGLGAYRHFIEDLMRQKAHILSDREEEIMAMAAEPLSSSSDIYTKFSNADLKFPNVRDDKGNEVELSEGRYVRLLESHDRQVRRDTFSALYSTYGLYKNTIAASLSASIKKDHFVSTVRHYRSTIEACLDADNVPVPVYDNLIETVNQNLPLMHRYLRLRKKALKLDALHMYDLYVPIVEAADKHVPYDAAAGLILEGLAPLGKRYIEDLESALRPGWADVYENVGKTRGAYSWGAYRAHPYILLNYQNTIDDVLTFAHELGHAMHTYYTNLAQPYVYSDYKIFVAEVACMV